MIENIAAIILLIGIGVLLTVGALVCVLYVSLEDE
jgi:hypothetical protein